MSRHAVLLLVPNQVPAAAVAIMSNMICYSSIATVARIWYIDFIPPTLSVVSCRCNFVGIPLVQSLTRSSCQKNVKVVALPEHCPISSHIGAPAPIIAYLCPPNWPVGFPSGASYAMEVIVFC